MNPRQKRNGAAWALSVLLALAFAAASFPKLLGAQVWLTKFEHWGYPKWFALAVGAVELLGGVLLLGPRVAMYGAGLLGVVMLGACYTHLANGESLQVLRPLIVLLLLAVVVWLRRAERTKFDGRTISQGSTATEP